MAEVIDKLCTCKLGMNLSGETLSAYVSSIYFLLYEAYRKISLT